VFKDKEDDRCQCSLYEGSKYSELSTLHCLHKSWDPARKVIGLGNPLLDVSAVVTTDILEKYGIKPDDAILAEDKHMQLFDDLVKDFDVSYIAGGACQNTLRVAQWIIRQPHLCTFFGAAGQDESLEIMSKSCEEVQLRPCYQIHKDQPTGRCAVCVTGHHRSLVTHLGAANCFTVDHLKLPENLEIIKQSSIVYISGYFLTVSPESIDYVCQEVVAGDKTLIMNFSAPFLCQFFKEPQMAAFPYVDIIIGNETEAATFAAEQNLGVTDLKEVAKKTSELPRRKGKEGVKRIVIITQGHAPVIVCKDGEVTEIPATTIAADNIVDTNGAGDAFVGGFLAMLMSSKPVEECVKCGIWAATQCIQQNGMTLPSNVTYTPA